MEGEGEDLNNNDDEARIPFRAIDSHSLQAQQNGYDRELLYCHPLVICILSWCCKSIAVSWLLGKEDVMSYLTGPEMVN